MTDAVDPPDGLKPKSRGRPMLKRITIGVLVIMMIMAMGCGKSEDSLKGQDGIAQDRVFVTFTVPYRDLQVSDLLESLGSHVIESVYYSDRVQVSVPDGKTAAEMIEALTESDLVELAQPYYIFDPSQVVVTFNVPYDDERVTELLQNSESRITRTYEYSDCVLVSVPRGKTVADMVDILSSSSLVDYAEPNYYAYI
jgi:Fervidolysin N-terminal prodomain